MADSRCSPVVVIPARLASVRLPDKPLADIGGTPMIVRVWRRAVAAAIGPVIVASGDPPIADAIRAAGGVAVPTDPDLPSGSDRVFQALNIFDPAGRHDVVINVQGDLPTLDPALPGAALRALESEDADIATLACLIRDAAEAANPHVVKAVVAWNAGGATGRALWFTRAIAPWGDGPRWHHIGLYAYRRPALARFVALPPSPLEAREKLEQLRALESGMRIAVARVDTLPLGVDTPADLARARALLAES